MLKIYDTLTREKREFKPRDPGRIGIYVCGVTPYAPTHIGHARVSVLWDVIKRYFEYKGYAVTLIQNFTDIDDKIIIKAQQEGTEAGKIAERYIEDYFEVMTALGVRPADHHPRVTQEIPEIITMIQGLIEGGHAYEAEGDVYFDVASFPEYGKLSGRSPEEMEAGARVEVSSRKRNPLDFALWKGAKPGEPAWESPWGMGRPGWHIECSVMSRKYLGDGFDFHGGGLDLIFPHHENEIAQSEAYSGDDFARYWVHNGMVQVDKEKMSKSIGNTSAVREVLRKWDPLVIRYFLISTHYRSPLNFSPEELTAASKGLERLVTAQKRLIKVAAMTPKIAGEKAVEIENLNQGLEQVKIDFEAAMNDDLNTALAISTLFNLVRMINPYLNQALLGQEEYQTQAWIELFTRYRDVLELFGNILGIMPTEATEHSGDDQLIGRLIELLLEVRNRARAAKNWDLADLIRDRLGQLGIEVKDVDNGTVWEWK